MSKTLAIQSLGSRVSWNYQTIQTWGNTSNSAGYAYNSTLANGTGVGQADTIYVATGTIAGAGTLSLLLTASLVDMLGNVITFARIKAVYLENTNATTSVGLSMGGAATHAALADAGGKFFNASTDTVAVRNGGNLFFCAPDATAYVVTATSTDSLLFTNLDGTNVSTYNLVLVGCSV